MPPEAAKTHPATDFGHPSDAGYHRQAGRDARPTENSLHPIALPVDAKTLHSLAVPCYIAPLLRESRPILPSSPGPLGDRLTVGQRTLTPFIEVRILVPQPSLSNDFVYFGVAPRIEKIIPGERNE